MGREWNGNVIPFQPLIIKQTNEWLKWNENSFHFVILAGMDIPLIGAGNDHSLPHFISFIPSFLKTKHNISSKHPIV